MPNSSSRLSDTMLELVARRFRLLGEPVRLRLLQELEDGEHTVGELVDALGSNQPNISRHLSALYEGGLLLRRRQGSNIVYGIADPLVFELCGLVCRSTREHMEEKLSALLSAVES